MNRARSCWLIIGVALAVSGCYRPSQMKMGPLLQPWRGTQAPSPSKPTKTPNVSTLAPKDLVDHVLRSNLRLRWLRKRRTMMLKNAQSHDLVSNPELRIMGLSGALADGKLDQLGVRLRWKPPFPTVHAATKDQAIALALADGEQVWLETYALLSSARLLYAQLVSMAEQAEQHKKTLALKKLRWRWEQTRRRAGVATTLEVAAARMAVIQQESSLSQLRLQHSAALSQLRVLLGVTGACSPAPPANFGTPDTKEPSRRALILQALKRSPGLAIIRHRYRAHKAALWIETSKRIPWFSFFQLSYELGETPWPYGFFLGFGIELPVFNWNSAKINQQKRFLKNLQVQARMQVGQIVQMVTSHYNQWKQATKQLKAAQTLLQRHIAQSQKLLKSTKQAGAQPPQRWGVLAGIIQLQEHLRQQRGRYHSARIALDRHSYTPLWKRFGLTPPKTKTP